MPFAEWQTIKGRFSIRHPTASSFFCSSSVKSSFSCETASAAGADDDCFGSRGGSSNGTTKSSAAQSARHYQQVTLKPRPVWKLLLALLWYQSTYICTERLDNACEPTVTNIFMEVGKRVGTSFATPPCRSTIQPRHCKLRRWLRHRLQSKSGL